MGLVSLASKRLGLALLAGVIGGCGCPPLVMTIPPGETARDGINPQRAIAELGPQTVPLRWLEIDETTTLTITARPSDEPGTAHYPGCEGEPAPSSYEVQAILEIETADGRLQGSGTTNRLQVSGDGKLSVPTPTWVAIGVPASQLAGTGVAPDVVLQRPGSTVGLTILLVRTDAGIVYGDGTLALGGAANIGLAEVNVTP